jgi:chromosome segregation ATPase
LTPDDKGLVRGLENAIEALREQLFSERQRVDELQDLLTQERRRARTSAPDTRGIIKEVIREIAGAAPPDDSDDDRQTLQTLESAVAALREQLESERCRSAQDEARADRAERRIDELQERLTVLRKRRQAGSVPSVPRPETTFDSRLPWWRRWFR